MAICITGCSETSMEETSQTEQLKENQIPEQFMIENVNYFDYQTGVECSAFASAYLLRHYGEEADGMQLYEDFPDKLSDGMGVMPSGITNFFKSKGYHAEYITNGTVEELKYEISKGAPVIVFIHTEVPYDSPHNTHYVPVVGYDKEYFYLAESLEYLANCKEESDLPYNRKIEINYFKELWLEIDNMWDNPYYIIY